jgi:uncharacterized membrane protein YbhN (UPF0104 family)
MIAEMSARKQWRRTAWAIKGIGIVLFLWILTRVDTAAAGRAMSGANIWLLLLALLVLIASNACKAVRWHAFVSRSGVRITLRESWEMYATGLFLGVITPGKIGELGRAGFLRQRGMPLPDAVKLTVIDRLTDVAVIGLLGLLSLGVLFGWNVFAYTTFAVIIGFLIIGVVLQKIPSRMLRALCPSFSLRSPRLVVVAFSTTLVSWFLYLFWAWLIMTALHTHLPIETFCAAIILAGVVSILPVAPSGLGTRDAALQAFLVPAGAAPPMVLALSLLLFLEILASNVIGGWYWLNRTSKVTFRP